MGDSDVAGDAKAPEHPPQERSKLAEAGISEETIEQGLSLQNLDPHDHAALKGLDHWQDIVLKRWYAQALLVLVAFQLAVADAVFIAYAWAGKGWRLEAGVIEVWLGATLVELIGVALVITRYLFPRRDASSGPMAV
jgi:hypothetical protein